MYMGPTEALYYSNAEIADGVFDDLPRRFKNFKARVRLLGNHYGSAGWADAWIDNAVFTWSGKDPGRVYRHVTQENRKKRLPRNRLR